MRILFCNYEYPPLGGGGGVINKQIAEELAKKHEVDVLTSQGLGLPRHSVENGVSVYRVPVFFRSRQAAANIPSMLAYLPSGYRTGRRLMRDHIYDVINTHFVVPTGPLGNWLSQKYAIPNVLSVHGGDLYDPSKWTSPHRHSFLRSAVRRLLCKADAVVGQSRNTLKNVYDYYDKDLECECVPLGILRPDGQIRASRSDYGISETDCILVTVGRLVSRKAVDQLIRILGEISNTSVQLMVIGSGPQEDSLRKIAQELGVSKRVHFLGQVDEQTKFEVLRMADVYVSTSQHEGFGIVYLEAMASELPVICYDYGGQTDFLTSDVNGYVVKLNDTGAFQQSCERLIEDSELRKKFTDRNLKEVEGFYIDRCADRYLQLFEQVIDRRRNGS
ncbi:MAG TPA: glycosyltransferase family 1 protein [Gammaproteobacteria bacterium]|nr:glycosyltransferase family 1 protein [Gammaproteobacteria bacterium]